MYIHAICMELKFGVYPFCTMQLNLTSFVTLPGLGRSGKHSKFISAYHSMLPQNCCCMPYMYLRPLLIYLSALRSLLILFCRRTASFRWPYILKHHYHYRGLACFGNFVNSCRMVMLRPFPHGIMGFIVWCLFYVVGIMLIYFQLWAISWISFLGLVLRAAHERSCFISYPCPLRPRFWLF
jgi:hypothetical protein